MTQTTPALSENCWIHLFYTAVSLLKILVLLTKCGHKRFLLTKCGPCSVSVVRAYFVGIIIIT